MFKHLKTKYIALWTLSIHACAVRSLPTMSHSLATTTILVEVCVTSDGDENDLDMFYGDLISLINQDIYDLPRLTENFPETSNLHF